MFGIYRFPRPSLGTVLGSLALIVALGGAAIAAIPGGDDTVTACISNDGAIRIIDAEAGKTCRGTQKTVKLATTDIDGKVANADTVDGVDSDELIHVAGSVRGDGTTSGTGYTVDRPIPGFYRVSFPAWWDSGCRAPIPSVTAVGGSFETARIATVTGVVCGRPGETASIEVVTRDIDGNRVDGSFWFTAVAGHAIGF